MTIKSFTQVLTISRFSRGLFSTKVLVALLTLLLVACNEHQDAAVPDSVGTTAPIDIVQISTVGSQSSSATVEPNPTPWLTVEAKEYGDSGVVIRLNASMDDPQRDADVLWVQTSGPNVVVINADQLSARIIIPPVDSETEFTFAITATSEGQTLSAVQTIIALPLPQKVSVQNAVIQPDDQVISVELSKPVPAGTPFTVNVAGGTAQEGVDFQPLIATAISLNGTDLEIPLTLLPSGRSEDVYANISIVSADGDPAVFTVVIPQSTSDVISNQNDSLQIPFAPVLEFDSLDLSSSVANFTLTVSPDAVIENIILAVNGVTIAENFNESLVDGALLSAGAVVAGENTFEYILSNAEQTETLQATVFIADANNSEYTGTQDVNVFVAGAPSQTFVGNDGDNIYLFGGDGDVVIKAQASATTNQLRLQNNTADDLRYFKNNDDLVIHAGAQNAELTLLGWFANPNEGNLIDIFLNNGEAIVIDDANITVPILPPAIVASVADDSGNLINGNPLRVNLDIASVGVPIAMLQQIDGAGNVTPLDFSEQATPSLPLQLEFSLDDFPEGETTLQFVVTDRFGIAASQTLFVAIAGNTPLVVTGAGDINVLIGGSASDVLTGGSGINIIYDGEGSDTLIGGGDTTLFIYENVLTTDFIYAGAGKNTLKLDLEPQFVLPRRSLDNDSLHLLIASTFDPQSEDVPTARIDLFNQIIASEDYKGIDEIKFNNGTVWDRNIIRWESLRATKSSDRIIGFDTDDTIEGLGGNDILFGGLGDDFMIGDLGNDNLYGGGGTDTYFYSLIGGNDVIHDTRDTSILQVEYFLSNMTLSRLAGTTFDVILEFSDERNSGSIVLINQLGPISEEYSGISEIQFLGNTVWTAEDIRQRALFCQGALETITGTESADVFTGQTVDDNFNASAGDDVVSGTAGCDVLDGGDGNDSLEGNDDDDILNGGNGNDILNGGSGDDTLNGGPGSDTIDPGEGNDRIEFALGDGEDTVVQNDIGSPADFTDVLVLGAGIDYFNMQLLRDTDDLILEIDDAQESIRFIEGYSSANHQPDFIELSDGSQVTVAELQDALFQYWPSDNAWAYSIIDPEIDLMPPNFSSPNTDTSSWLIGNTPFSSIAEYPFASGFDLNPLRASEWSPQSILWLHRDIEIPEGAYLELKVLVDDSVSIWVNDKQYAQDETSGSEGETYFLVELQVPYVDLNTGLNRIIIRAEDFGGDSYIDVQATVVIPPLDERTSTINLANACNGIMPSTLPAQVNRVVNPYEGAAFYIDPDFVTRVTASQQAMADDLLIAAAEQVKQESTAIWLDSTAKLCGESADGRIHFLDHLIAASAQASANNPVTLSTVVFNLPSRDCYSQSNPGEFDRTEEGALGYQQYINTFAALAANFPDVRVVAAIEPGALGASAQVRNVINVPATECEFTFADRYYDEGISYALRKLKTVPNVYSYLDVGHAAWLGWENRLDEVAATINDWVTAASYPQGAIPEGEGEGNDGEGAAIADFTVLTGLATNISAYIPLDEPFLLDLTEGNMSQLEFYNWNFIATAKSYAKAITQKVAPYANGEILPTIIDTARNGWGGINRPQVAGFGDDFKVDRRLSRDRWCNNNQAGLGAFPQLNPLPAVDQTSYNVHAYYWFKPPGESDGDRVIQCTEPSLEGLPNPTPASAWFPEHFEQLLKNAWPPLIVPVAAGFPASVTLSSSERQVARDK